MVRRGRRTLGLVETRFKTLATELVDFCKRCLRIVSVISTHITKPVNQNGAPLPEQEK
jgi:hypothetical protein